MMMIIHLINGREDQNPSYSRENITSPKTLRKKSLRTRDFDIDNIVIPFNLTGSAQHIPVIRPKEIFVPVWKNIEDYDTYPTELQTKMNTDDSSNEDTSDEVFSFRHKTLEIQERSRYLMPIEQQKKKIKRKWIKRTYA